MKKTVVRPDRIPVDGYTLVFRGDRARPVSVAQVLLPNSLMQNQSSLSCLVMRACVTGLRLCRPFGRISLSDGAVPSLYGCAAFMEF